MSLLKVIGFLASVAFTLATTRPDPMYPGTDTIGPPRPERSAPVLLDEEGPATVDRSGFLLESTDERTPSRERSLAGPRLGTTMVLERSRIPAGPHEESPSAVREDVNPQR